MSATLSLIAAMDRNRLIGRDNKLPWRLPADMRYFKNQTMGKPVLMGRKTFQSIGKPLPGRENIVLTRDRDFAAEGCRVIHDLEAWLQETGDEEVMVIGGEEVYRHTLDLADKLYITVIDHAFSGDSYFPEIREEDWEIEKRIPGKTDDRNRYPHEFRVYRRKR